MSVSKTAFVSQQFIVLFFVIKCKFKDNPCYRTECRFFLQNPLMLVLIKVFIVDPNFYHDVTIDPIIFAYAHCNHYAKK